MSFFGKVVDFLSGGLGGKIVDAVKDYFPPSMSDKEKTQLSLAIQQAARDHEIRLLEFASRETEEFNNRVRDLEGTAADLNSAGFPGKIVMFLRGALRPIWGYIVIYMDYMVFSGKWKLSQLAQPSSGITAMDLQSAFWIINFLVLGFLFGERAMRNVMPFFQQKTDLKESSARG